MYVNPEIYNVKNLNEEDKRTAGWMQECIDLICEDAVDGYIEEQCEGMGEMTAQLFRESVAPFLSYLHQLSEYKLCDFIIGQIEGYSEAELKANMRSRMKRKTGTA
jgi:hypothetical protein